MDEQAPQTPPLRRTYKRIPMSAKRRIVNAFDNAKD
ncbi:hypothetical protein H257_16611 [Aphanomyces astaci]|uniref:Uncharacterized protein n=1 Tax=Aphanomyces astaci TaxID=112090 RepID=W4FHT9_APHAT|nr:hypothetical protein H257_16611 [Aphanomyces astaci]ETV67035.1 hypothetical protein H257_16611 [Aphanomyces astaci]|eukprot:XP_009843404.1 hypothetical protein H257_16611 [Aphanomyces astaci]